MFEDTVQSGTAVAATSQTRLINESYFSQFSCALSFFSLLMSFQTIFRGQGNGSVDKVLEAQMWTRVPILRNT